MRASVVQRYGRPLVLAPGYWLPILGILAAMYLVGIYASELVVAAIGKAGYDASLLLEVFHDMRHAAGFMCH